MFFTTPTDCPSGVSAGHKKPQDVLCNLRGGTNLPLLSVGVDILRKWLNPATYVNLFKTCATPTLFELVCLIPKSPVDKARLNPFSMVFDLIILLNLIVYFKVIIIMNNYLKIFFLFFFSSELTKANDQTKI